jgi:hypothetical protein
MQEEEHMEFMRQEVRLVKVDTSAIRNPGGSA